MKLNKRELLEAYKFFHKDMLYEKVNIKLLSQFFELENNIIPREVKEIDEKEIEKKVKDKLEAYVNDTIQKEIGTYKVVKKVERETSLNDTILKILNSLNDNELKNADISKYVSEGIVEKANKTSFSSDTYDDDKIQYNNFIDLSIKDYFIDYVMLDSLGRKMDSKLPDYLYANRMNNREARTLFKPYFLGYSAYTNDLIANVKKNIQNNNDIIIFQIDFTRFYYNIDVALLKQEVNNFIKGNEIQTTTKERKLINRIFKIHENYNHLESVQGLPLGLKSSGIFSNIFAMQFDEKFIKERPLFYGRYVDDISFVFKKEYDVQGNPLEEITSYITDETLLELFKSSNIENVQNVSINKSKTVTIDIPKDVDKNYITEFERKLKRTGSGFNLIFDPTGIGLKISQIYSNNNSIVTKSSQIIDMKKNTTSIKMFIGAMYDWYKMILLKENMNISESYKVIYEKYWNEFISCVDDLTLIELSSYWLNLLILDAVFNQEKPLTKKIEMLVKDSKHSSLKEVLKIIKEINDKYLSNSNKTKDMLTSARLKDFRNYPKEHNQKENFNVLTSNGYKAYSCLHRVKIYEEQIFKFESQLINSSNRASIDIECINEINSLNISKTLMELKEQAKLLKNINNRDFRSFYQKNEKDVKKYEENFKVSLSVEKEFDSYYENFLHGLDIKTSGYVNFLQEKMTASFNDAVKEKSNLLVYPEHSIPFVTLQNLVKKSIENNIIVMGGLVPLKTNDNVILNLHITIIPIKKVGEIELNDAIIRVRHKKHLSPAETKALNDIKSSQNGKININPNLDSRYKEQIDNLDLNETIVKLTNKISIKAYNCFEVYDINLRNSPQEVTLIALSVNNKDLSTFEHIINTMAIDHKAFVAQANFSNTGGVGVYAPMTKTANRNIISTHKSEGHGKIITSTLNFRELYKARYDAEYSKKNNWKPTPPNLIKEGLPK